MSAMARIKGLCLVISFFAAGHAFGAKQETWVQVTSPHFVILSNAGEKQARQTAERFEQIRTVFRQSMAIAGGAPGPVITVFAVKDETSLRELLPEYWAKGHAHPAGIFFQRLNVFYAAIQLDASFDNPYEGLYHEYYHSLTMPYFPGLPVWVAEGLAEFFGNTRIDDKLAYMGQPNPGWIQELRQGRFIPLDVLLAADHSSPYYNEQNKTSLFYAESWALTHYLIIGDKGTHKQLLTEYLDAIGHGATGEEAAKAFGNLHDLQRDLQRYVDNDRFYQFQLPLPAKPEKTDMQARTLSSAEIDANLGGFATLRGHAQEGKPLLEGAVRSDPKLALAWQNLGLAEFFDGERTDALKSVSTALDIDPKNALTHYLRAYLTFNTAGLANGPDIEHDLRASIAASSDFAPPYGLLALCLLRAEDTIPEALALARKAVSIEPGTPTYRIDLAEVLMRMGRFDDADNAVAQARVLAKDPQERAQADQLLAVLRDAKGADASFKETLAHQDTLRRQPETQQAPESRLSDSPKPAESSQSSELDDVASANTQSVREVTGVVTKLTCNPGVGMEVAGSGGTYRLRVPTNGNFRVEMGGVPTAGFDPCSSFKGLRVTIHYEPDQADTRSGQVEELEILTSESK